jgi:ppGpp synthetase/RelA/SpoT-type nucleotidyltranferase
VREKLNGFTDQITALDEEINKIKKEMDEAKEHR